MSAADLVFKTSTDSETIYGPVLVSGTDVSITVTNYGVEDLSDLGFYLRPSANLGDVDNPATFPPETDYQDLLTWGTRTVAGLEVTGGVIIGFASQSHYVTRSAGSGYGQRILVPTLAAGDSMIFTVKLETPAAFSTRRFFVDLLLE